MDAELKAKWIAALRGGDYKQGQNHLRSADQRFCCLGVLCDIVMPEAWDDDHGHYGHATSFPSGEVLQLCGVSDDSSQSGHPFWPLAYMNDDGKSFAQIADYIEQNL